MKKKKTDPAPEGSGGVMRKHQAATEFAFRERARMFGFNGGLVVLFILCNALGWPEFPPPAFLIVSFFSGLGVYFAALHITKKLHFAKKT